MGYFFKVKTPGEVYPILKGFGPTSVEEVGLDQALGRVLSQDVFSPEDLPDFCRSTVDGFAVRAKDTFGATEALPGLLEIIGRVAMGEGPTECLGKGQAMQIHTGGMLPRGSDAVVMVEHCHVLDERTLEAGRSVHPLENVIQAGDDFSKGSQVRKQGDRLRPQDIGVMAGIGLGHVKVHKRPRVAIISTGDEVVPVEQVPGPGKVRDINRYTLSNFCRQGGADFIYLGICPDSFDPLKDIVEEGLGSADTVWISGGSSVGTRDLTLKVFETLKDFELLVHGISISPGKPTIIGRSGHQPLVGLPGHVASALVVAEIFLTRLISRLSGRDLDVDEFHTVIQARLSRNVESAPGREDYVRVRLRLGDKGWIADPLFGKSGLISTLVEADGLLPIPLHTEGLYGGDLVNVILFRAVC